MKLAVIIVTYNRKELLAESIHALLKQSYKDFDMIIVDNNSDDGTEEVVNKFVSERLFYYNTNENLGGAGGFNYGLKLAYKLGFDHYLLIDDDSILDMNCIENLVKASNLIRDEYGFLATMVKDINNNYCNMNSQILCSRSTSSEIVLTEGFPFIRIKNSSFVGFLINNRILIKYGLPIKDFFIWGDDYEYSTRISKNEKCYLIINSLILHKISNPCGTNLISESDSRRIKRFELSRRNGFYTAKRDGINGLLRYHKDCLKTIFGVLFKSKNYKLLRLRVIFISYIKGLFFSPRKEMVCKDEDN